MTAKNPNTIAVCMVVYHEEAVIERCLASVKPIADEIIIVHDGPCQDKTVEIARSFGATVIIGERYGFSELHRTETLQTASATWVMWLDADEFLSEELREAVKAAVKEPVDAIQCIWPLWDGKKAVTHGWPYRQFLYRKSALHYIGFPHEPFRTDGPVLKIPEILHHQPTYNNYTWKRFWTKWRTWARIQAEWSLKPFNEIQTFQWDSTDWPARYQLARRFSWLFPILGMAAAFLSLKSGSWKAGWYGIKQSLMWGAYVALVYWYVTVLKLSRS